MFLVRIWPLVLCILLSISLETMLIYLKIIQAERTELTSPAKPYNVVLVLNSKGIRS